MVVLPIAVPMITPAFTSVVVNYGGQQTQLVFPSLTMELFTRTCGVVYHGGVILSLW